MCNKPTMRELAGKPICPNCGGDVVRRSTRGPVPTFCDSRGAGVCKKEFANRQLVEGRAVISLMKAWRADRGSGEVAKAAFAEAVTILDGFNADDRKAERPHPRLYVAKLLWDGYRFIDRKCGWGSRKAAPADAESAA
jgi:hypothetical protein